MIAKNVTIPDLYEALRLTNLSFKDNVIWNRKPSKVGKRYRFTIKVKNSKESGAGRSATHIRKDGERYRLTSACWHVHGTFFDNLLLVNENAVIGTTIGMHTHKISFQGGNWKDYERGSLYRGSILASELCDCGSS